MNEKVAITVDVEGDNLWDFRSEVACNNLRSLRCFHKLATEFGFEPTYLVSFEVLENPLGRSVLEGIMLTGGCEIGTHLHPWLTPPLCPEDHNIKRYPSDLSKQEFSEKLTTLHSMIKNTLGVDAKSYRAGAWGFSVANAEVLMRLGYEVDSSITPYVSWKNNPMGSDGGPDYRNFGPEPFFLSTKDGLLLEIPVSIVLRAEWPLSFRWLRSGFLSGQQPMLATRIGRVAGLRPSWFRPFGTRDLARLVSVHKKIVSKGINIAVFMIHSSELLAGASPRFRTKADEKDLFSMLQQLFRYMSKENVKGITLKEYRRVTEKTTPTTPCTQLCAKARLQ